LEDEGLVDRPVGIGELLDELDVALGGGFVVVHVGLDVGLVGFAFFG
jgi:hypothetical protein